MSNDRYAKRALPPTTKAGSRPRRSSKKLSSRAVATFSVLSIFAAGAIALSISPDAQAASALAGATKFNADFQNVDKHNTILSGYKTSTGITAAADAFWNGTQANACNGVIVLGTYDDAPSDAWNCSIADGAVVKPAATEPATAEPAATTAPATTEPATTEPATAEPATTEPVTSEPESSATASGTTPESSATSSAAAPEATTQASPATTSDAAAQTSTEASPTETSPEAAAAAPAASPAQNQAAAYYSMQKLSRALQKFANTTDGTNVSLTQNNAAAYLTGGARASAGETLIFGAGEAGVPVSPNRYYQLQADFAAYCTENSPQIELWLDGKRVSETVSTCDTDPKATNRASYAAGANEALNPTEHKVLAAAAGDSAKSINALDVNVVRITSTVLLTEKETLRVEVRNANTGTTGNDGALDNVRLVDVSPTVTSAISGENLVAGDTARMSYTIRNTTGEAAKAGWSLKDALPQGIVVAGDSNVRIECRDAAGQAVSGKNNIAASLTAGTASVSIAGDLPNMAATCTVSFDVTAKTAGTYTTNPETLDSALSNGVKPTSVTFATAASSPAPTTEASTAAPATSTPAQVVPVQPAVVAPNGPTDFNVVAPPVLAGQPSKATLPKQVDVNTAVLKIPAGSLDITADQRSYTDPNNNVQYSLDVITRIVTAAPPLGYTGSFAPAAYSAKDSTGTSVSGTITFPVAEHPIEMTQAFTTAQAATAAEDSPTFPAPAGVVASSMNLVDGQGKSVKNLIIPGEATYVVNADGSITVTRASTYTGILSNVNYVGQTSNGSVISGVASFASTDVREYATPALTGKPATWPADPSVDVATVSLTVPDGATAVKANGKGFTSADGVVYAVSATTGNITATPPATRKGPVGAVQFTALTTGAKNVSGSLFFPIHSYDVQAPPQPLGKAAVAVAPEGLTPTSVRIIDPRSGQPVMSYEDSAAAVLYTVNGTFGSITATPKNSTVATIPAIAYTGTSADGTAATGTVRFTVSGVETIAPEVKAGSNSIAPAPDGVFASSVRIINPETGRSVSTYTDPVSGIIYFVDPNRTGSIHTQVPAGYVGLTPSIEFLAFSDSLDVQRGIAKFPTNSVASVAPEVKIGAASTAPLTQFALAESIVLTVPANATAVGIDGRSYTSASGVRYVVNENGSITATPPANFSQVIPAAPYTGRSANNSDFSGSAKFPINGADVFAPAVDYKFQRSTSTPFAGVIPSTIRMIDPVTNVIGAPSGGYSSKDGGVNYVVDPNSGTIKATPGPTYYLPTPAIKYVGETADGTKVTGSAFFPNWGYNVAAPIATGWRPSRTPVIAGIVPSTLKVASLNQNFTNDDEFRASATFASTGITYSAESNGSVTSTPMVGYSGERPRNGFVGYMADGTRVIGWAYFPVALPQMTAPTVDMGVASTAGPGADTNPTSLVFVAGAGIELSEDRKSYTDPKTRIFYQISPEGTITATPPVGYVGAVPSATYTLQRATDGQTVTALALFPNNPLRIVATQVGPMNPVTSPTPLGVSIDPMQFKIPDGAVEVSPDKRAYSITTASGDLLRYELNADGTVTATPPGNNYGPVPSASYTTVTADGNTPVEAIVQFNLQDAFFYAPHVNAGSESVAPAPTGVAAASVRLVAKPGATEVDPEGKSFIDSSGIRYFVAVDGSIHAAPPADFTGATPPVSFTGTAADATNPASVAGTVMFNMKNVNVFAPATDIGENSTVSGPAGATIGSIVFDIPVGDEGVLSADKKTYTSSKGVVYTVSGTNTITATVPAGYKEMIDVVAYRAEQKGISANPAYWSDILGFAVFPLQDANVFAQPTEPGTPTAIVAIPQVDQSTVRLLDPTTNEKVTSFIDAATGIAYNVLANGSVQATPPTDWEGVVPSVRYIAVAPDGLTNVTGTVSFTTSSYDLYADPVLAGEAGTALAPKLVVTDSMHFVDAAGAELGRKYTDPVTKVVYEILSSGSVRATPPADFKGYMPAIRYKGVTDAGAAVSGTVFYPKNDHEVVAPVAAVGTESKTAVPTLIDITNGGLWLLDPLTGKPVTVYTDSETKVKYTVSETGTITATPPAGYVGVIPSVVFEGRAKDGTGIAGAARFPVKGLMIQAPAAPAGEAQSAPMLEVIDASTVVLLIPEDARDISADKRGFTSADGLVRYEVLADGSVRATPLSGFKGAFPGVNWVGLSRDGTTEYGVAQFPQTTGPLTCVARGKGIDGSVDINQSFEGQNIDPNTTVLIDPATAEPTTAKTVSSVARDVTYSINNTGIITAKAANDTVDIQPVAFMVLTPDGLPYSGVVDFVSSPECALMYRITENRTNVYADLDTQLVAWNLASKATYTVDLQSTPVRVASFTTEADGHAKVNVKVPAGTAPGLHHWVVRDAKGKLVGSLAMVLLERGQEPNTVQPGQELAAGILPDGVTLPGIVPQQPGATVGTTVTQPGATTEMRYVTIPGQIVDGKLVQQPIETGVPAVTGYLAATGVDATPMLLLAGLAALFGAGLVTFSARSRRRMKN